MYRMVATGVVCFTAVFLGRALISYTASSECLRNEAEMEPKLEPAVFQGVGAPFADAMPLHQRLSRENCSAHHLDLSFYNITLLVRKEVKTLSDKTFVFENWPYPWPGHYYHTAYDHFLTPLRPRRFRLLEIGLGCNM
jgi:hypothetical protein